MKSYIILIFSLNFMFVFHPFLACLNLIILIMCWILFSYNYNSFNWINNLILLVYFGGLLILFIYFCSVLPQSKEKFFKKKFFFSVFFLLPYFIFMWEQNFSQNFFPIFSKINQKDSSLIFSLLLYTLFIFLVFIGDTNMLSRQPLRLI